MDLDLQQLLDLSRDAPLHFGFLGAILGGVASALVGGLLSGSSARSTNQSNQAIAAQETEFNQASAREANALTEKLAGNAIKSTEGMTASALALSRTQFDQSQAYNERMSNTAYTRGIKDLRAAGLNPILAATRGQTSTPSVSGGPAPSGSGTGGSGTSARASQFRKVDAGLQALNSAAAVGRATVDIQRLETLARKEKDFGYGSVADKADAVVKTGKTTMSYLSKKGKDAQRNYRQPAPGKKARPYKKGRATQDYTPRSKYNAPDSMFNRLRRSFNKR